MTKEVHVPVYNFLLIKKVIDTPGEERGLTLVGTLVQSVYEVDVCEKNKADPVQFELGNVDGQDFFFKYRFGDDDGKEFVSIRRPEISKVRMADGSKMKEIRTTFQAKIPLSVDVAFDAFPFTAYQATAEIELSTASQGDLRLRPTLLLTQEDRRGNVAIQEVKTRNNLPPTPKEIDKKVDRSKHYDFVTPYPELTYEYDSKKGYCPRLVLHYRFVNGGYKKFIELLFPMLLITLINTFNVIHDNNKDYDLDPHTFLATQAALALTVVFQMPSISELSYRQAFWTANNLYIGWVFCAMIISSIPSEYGEAINIIGAIMLGTSFLLLGVNFFRYRQFTGDVENKTTNHGTGSYLKDDNYEAWNGKPNWDEFFVSVHDIVEGKVSNGNYKKAGIFGKFETVTYNKVAKEKKKTKASSFDC